MRSDLGRSVRSALRAPDGLLGVRTRGSADEAFEQELVAATDLALIQLEPALRDQLARLQFTAREQSYRARFPDAATLIITERDQAVGRLVVDESHDEIRIVHVAIDPRRQGNGLGGAVLSAVMACADERQVPTALTVAADNVGAQRLYARMGFEAVATTETDIEMCAPVGASAERHMNFETKQPDV